MWENWRVAHSGDSQNPKVTVSKLLPNARILTLADVYRLLGRQTADDAIEAGWLMPRCLKEVPRGPQRRLFALSDVHDVEDRILAGEYPGQARQTSIRA